MINREDVARVQREILPADAIFKGYEDVVIQDIALQTDNVLFHKEKYYSPSQQKTYLAALPAGYEGQFGPGIKTLIQALYYGSQVTEPKILEFVGHIGIQISPGQISNMLIKGREEFHAESDAVFDAGQRSSPYQHIDDTTTRVNGKNQNCHILCNQVSVDANFASWHTMNNPSSREYHEAYHIIIQFALSAKQGCPSFDFGTDIASVI